MKERRSVVDFSKINVEEEKKYCFDNIYNLGLMLKDNHELFHNLIDSETLKKEYEQQECLSFLLSPKLFVSFCEYLYMICHNAGQIRTHAYGGYAYIKFQDDIFYVNIMADKVKVCQFALVDEMPEEDKKIVPFNILLYGLEPLSELFDKNTKKCFENACVKYKVTAIENPKIELDNYYYINPNKITYHFENGYDNLFIKRLAMVYYCWAKPKVRRPVFNDLALHLEAWNIALQQMKKDGIKVLGQTEEKYFIRNKILRNFVNFDIMAFFQRCNGLFEEKKEPKVTISLYKENAHVETSNVQESLDDRKV